MQAAAEFAAEAGQLVFRAVGVGRQSDDQMLGLPFPYQLGDGVEFLVIAVAGNRRQGCDKPSSASPCATPIRASPKSNAKTVPVGALCMTGSTDKRIGLDAQLGECSGVAVFIRHIEQNMFVRLHRQPDIVRQLAFKLPFAPARIAYAD